MYNEEKTSLSESKEKEGKSLEEKEEEDLKTTKIENLFLRLKSIIRERSSSFRIKSSNMYMW